MLSLKKVTLTTKVIGKNKENHMTKTLLIFVLCVVCTSAYSQKAIISNPESGQDRVLKVTGVGLENLSEDQFINLPEGRYTGTMECIVDGKKYSNTFDFTVGKGDESVWLFTPTPSCSPSVVTNLK
jgi:hypothetical protein